MPLIILYLLSRVFNLLNLPPFVDELLYIRWTDTIASNWKSAWLPVLEDGQPPLFFWLGALLKRVTHFDTLLILRSISILAGVVALYILIKLGSKLFNKKIGSLIGLIYILFSMFLWYDRLGMRESIITLSGLLVLYGIIDRIIFKIEKGSYLVLLGISLGIMTKGTAIIFLPWVFMSYLVYRKHLKFNRNDAISAVIGLIVILGLYFGAHKVIDKSETFILSLSMIKSRIYPNMYSTVRWIIEYTTLPVALLGLFGGIKLYLDKFKANFLLLFPLIITLAIEIILAGIYFPRYFLWTLIIWVIFIAYGVNFLAKSIFYWIVIGLLFIPMLIFDYKIIASPETAPLPAIEKWQYISGWPSGYGIKKMAIKISEHKADYLVVENDEVCKTGLPYYGLRDITMIPIRDSNRIIQLIAGNSPIYLCMNISKELQDDTIQSMQVVEIDRPGRESSIRLYELRVGNDQ